MNDQIRRYQSASNMASNKFIYMRQQIISSIQNGQPKVLINPNFVQVAHVKPHFNKHFFINQTIHVNPNMLKRSENEQMAKSKVTGPQNNVHMPSKAVVATATKLIRVPQKKLDNSNVLVSTPTKLVRMPKHKGEGSQLRQTSIHTKYKIIRHPSMLKNGQKQDADIKKLYYVKNRFRIDHRSPKKLVSSQTVIRRSSIFNRNLSTTLKTKNVYVKCNSKLNKTQYVSINGILYKRSSKSLISINKKTKISRTKASVKEQLLTIRGQKYKLDSNHRTLTLISKPDENVKQSFKTIYLGGVTFKQTKPNLFVKTNTSQKHLLLSHAKQKSIHTLTNKMRKSNIPCLFYHKFGKCRGRDNGTCSRIHNPDQISLCPKFLQGACINDKCLLSHKVSAEKMPTCKFFLEGLCSKDDCPYLHVKINGKAEICKDFLEGFCRKAAECDKRHQYLCADFERTGNCAKKKCHYPHGNMVRKYRFSKIASKLQIHVKCCGNASTVIMNSKNHPVFDNRTTTISKNTKVKYKSKPDSMHIDNNIPEKVLNLRYYDESTPSTTKEILDVPKESAEFEIVDLDLEQTDPSFVSPLRTRPKVGILPLFIPFLDEEQS